MLNGIHFLLTYTCTNECDHCFLYCSPNARGTFTLEQVKNVLKQCKKIGTINQIFFEGGEPFLFYPLLLNGIKAAKELGFEIGIVTNCYWAISPKDAEIWLGPLIDAGLTDISLSDDAFHDSNGEDEKPKNASKAAEKLGLDAGIICINAPEIKDESSREKGEPIIGGSTCFKGRAADNLTDGLLTKPWESFTKCDQEDFISPGRVHVDAFGNVQLCQGISLGNMWETPLADLMNRYEAQSHPICSHLANGGPAQLAKEYKVKLDGDFVDECHFCFNVRRALMDRFPRFLTPRQVYGRE